METLRCGTAATWREESEERRFKAASRRRSLEIRIEIQAVWELSFLFLFFLKLVCFHPEILEY